MGCRKLTYSESLPTLEIVSNNLKISVKSYAGDYRYGYQGSEKDDEIKGEGNSYTTHFRQLDSRIGRWLSIDPKSSSMPWQSPFVSMDNNPIFYNDILGDIVDKRNASGNKKAFRKFKRNIKRLRKNSASFEKMYSDMENRDDLFVFELANRKGAETLII